MRALFVTVALCLLALTGPVSAQLPPNDVPPSVRSEISSFERAILQNAGRIGLGQSTTWASGDGLSGIIRFRNEYSRSRNDPSVPCEACIDPCRTFTTTYQSPAGQGEFRGVACFTASANGYRLTDLREYAWLPAPPPEPVPSPVAPPETIIVQQVPVGPVPMSAAAFLAAIAPPLAELGYTSADGEGAFNDYVRDYALELPMAVVSAATLSEQMAMVEAAKTRARQDAATSSAPAANCAALKAKSAQTYFGVCR